MNDFPRNLERFVAGNIMEPVNVHNLILLRAVFPAKTLQQHITSTDILQGTPIGVADRNRAVQHLSHIVYKSNAIAKVKQYIDEHFCENITRDTLGEIVYLSPGYLAASFKRETGSSLGSYIIERRMEKAKALLADGKLTVSFQHYCHILPVH